jgi:hypothetical protein
MGFDLVSTETGKTFMANLSGWQGLLELAHRYGWTPAGTILEDEDGSLRSEWSGTYYSNDYQLVTEYDARQFADAIERALPDIPRHDATYHKTEQLPGFPLGLRVPTGEPISLHESFSGRRGRQFLCEFVRFARAGAFVIG